MTVEDCLASADECGRAGGQRMRGEPWSNKGIEELVASWSSGKKQYMYARMHDAREEASRLPALIRGCS